MKKILACLVIMMVCLLAPMQAGVLKDLWAGVSRLSVVKLLHALRYRKKRNSVAGYRKHVYVSYKELQRLLTEEVDDGQYSWGQTRYFILPDDEEDEHF